MPKRITNPEEKLIPRLSFKIPIQFDLVGTLSMDYRTAENFKLKTSNNDDTVSKSLRNILFKKMGLKDKKAFYDFISVDLEAIREKIHLKIGVTKDNSFSNIILQEIKKHENEI